MIRPSLALLALLTALPVAAQIYSWKDKDGKIHYSDTPPPTGEIKTLQRPSRTPPPVQPSEASGDNAATANKPGTAAEPAKPKTLAERELEFRQRRAAEAEAQAKAEKEAAEAADRQRACEQARNQLAALNSGQRVSRFNAAGERVVLDDAARNAEIAQTQRMIDQACQ